MKIGIAITTHNRPELIQRALQYHSKYLPPDSIIVVVDDGSTTPFVPTEIVTCTIRNKEAKGIASAKNQCIDALMTYGCDQLFLFDDDCWPQREDWYLAYINSPEPHLAHSWDLIQLYQDGQHTAYHASGGAMLYYDRKVIEDVGGMRTCFGKYGCEHVNLSDRIHNRGWTTWRYADLTSSADYLYACDHYEARHKSTVTKEQLQHNLTKGKQFWISLLEDNEYVPYAEDLNVVITSYYTGRPDPQRSGHWDECISKLDNLINSIQFGRLAVLNDCWPDAGSEIKTANGHSVAFIDKACDCNPYFARWLNVYQYLRDYPDIKFVWCVDATDVEQLRNPFDMELGKLYIGQEQSTLRNQWLLDNHPDTKVQLFIKNHPDLTLLNPGTVGGDRATVMEFAHAMTKYFFDDYIDKLQGWETNRAGVGDMGACQLICYTQFADRLIYGPSVNTLFKGEQSDSYARWKHK